MIGGRRGEEILRGRLDPRPGDRRVARGPGDARADGAARRGRGRGRDPRRLGEHVPDLRRGHGHVARRARARSSRGTACRPSTSTACSSPSAAARPSSATARSSSVASSLRANFGGHGASKHQVAARPDRRAAVRETTGGQQCIETNGSCSSWRSSPSCRLAAVGCGGDDDDDGAAQETGATDTGGPSRRPRSRCFAIAWGAEPPSLDPGKATDTTSSNVILALMDPLVKLNPDTLEPEAVRGRQLGGRRDTSSRSTSTRTRRGRTATRSPPRTYVYSWKRTLSPELAADYAYQLYGVKGAAEYNGCEADCEALADEVGVTAVDDYTLQVELTSEQPWFLGQVSHHSFLPVHQATVEEFGDNWTDPGEHRHQRPLHARVVGPRGLDQHGQEPRLPRRRERRARADRGLDHRRRHHPRCRPSRPARSTRSTAPGSRPRRSSA